ncbi:MAG: ABC transporter permease [Anaerolineae bacterium]
MRHLLDVYRTQLRTTMIVQLQYRAAVVIWLIEMVLEPLVYLIVWGTVARASGGSLGTYTTGGFAAYYVALMVVNHLTFTWIMWEYEYRVRQGAYNAILLRPVHPIHADISDNVAYKLLTSLIMLPTAAAMWLLFDATASPPLWAMLAFVPALFLSFLARFLLEWTLATAAFWTTRVEALNQVYFVAFLFLSGQIAPLSLMPAAVRTVASVLPFRWLVSFPVELLLGRLTPADAVIGLGAQLLWTGLALGILAFVWRRGVRRYSAVGA